MGSYSASEYLIHPLFISLKPPRNPFFLKLLKRLHYDHQYGSQQSETAVFTGLVQFSIYRNCRRPGLSSTASISLTLAFVSGVITFLLYYEWTHLWHNRPIQPWTPWGKWMKKVHLWHYFKNEHFWFGVTQPFYDVLFGTFKEGE